MKMKKYLIMTAFAMLVFASCTNDEDQSEPQEINFSAFNYKPTRAPITGTTYGTDAPDFGVFAALVATTNATSTETYALNYETSLSYMDDVKIKYDGSTGYKIWRPVGASDAFVKYYWPLTGKLTFVGYTPYSVTADFVPTTRTFTITNYSADEVVANQADVMYSKISSALDITANNKQYTDGGGTKSGVNIIFNHALSQIVFRAKTDKEYTDATFNIDYVKVQDVLNTGNLLVSNDAVVNDESVVDGWTTSGVGQNFQPVSTISLTKDLAVCGDALLLIPQYFSNDVKVEIKYTMTPDNGLTSSKVVSIQINEDDKINLDQIKAGKKYFIDLTVSANEILFAPSVPVDWADQTAQPNQNL